MLINRLDPSQSQIVIYNSESFKNKIDRLNQELTNHLFQVELFTYPMQQKQLKREIKFLISQQSLSFKAFLSIFPQIVEITKPEDKLGLVFELFRQFAENPSEEICGRFYWTYYKGKHLEDYNEKKCFLDITICKVTRDALVSSIFGMDNSEKLQRLTFNVKNEDTLKKAWLKIEKNSHLLQMQSTNFIAYSFGINAAHAFSGHAFLVIQYLNREGKLQYRIFQSYLGEFCLNDYLKKNNNVLDSDRFMIFLEGLQECLLADKWTHSLEMFYVNYFNTKKGFRVGDINPARDENGKLIMDEEDVKWVEQIVTLKTATKDVIAELNKLIQNSSDQTLINNKRLLVLNTNKDPFKTYNTLGVPLDKFYISKEEEKQLWLRRIINALVSKGYISKLERVNGHGYFIEV